MDDIDLEIGNVPETDLQRKFDNVLLNNGWNDKNEKLIASIGENCKVYKVAHKKSASKYYMCSRIISVLIVALNSVLSVQSSMLEVELPFRIIIYIVTVVSVINNFLDYQVLATKHKTASGLFSEITHAVQQQMCNYRRDRELAVKYIQETLKRYDHIIANAPSLSDRSLETLKKKYAGTGISMPDQIEKIEIVTDLQGSPQGSPEINVLNCTIPSTQLNPLKIQGEIEPEEENQYLDYIRKSKQSQLQYQMERL